jgi:hypothetical protein
MDFAGGFVLPVRFVLDRPVECLGSVGTIIDTATAIPAFFRIQDNWRFTFLRMRDINVDLADLHAMVATCAFVSID